MPPGKVSSYIFGLRPGDPVPEEELRGWFNIEPGGSIRIPGGSVRMNDIKLRNSGVLRHGVGGTSPTISLQRVEVENLADWRIETLALGEHAFYLMKRYWQSHVSFSFPRLRPASSATRAPTPVLPVSETPATRSDAMRSATVS